MIRVMLSLDLIGAEEKRADLYGTLEDAGWKKARNVDTVWVKEFRNYSPNLDEDRLKELRGEIATPFIAAYKSLKLSKVYYVAQIGNECVISREVETRGGKLMAYAQSVF
ncbi:hypothetical protein ACF8E6_11255 [Pseudomonas sp. xss_1]|uniref:hypothetical protein n=1 Tax=Pseudomonas sp. xss_1 TaxID=3367214 RepID=UPI00370A4C78